MEKDQSVSCRHKDFKWVSGIIAFAFLAITFALFNLVYLTSKPIAVELGTIVAASMFSPHGLDDATEINILRRQKTASGTIQPIPGLPVTVATNDLEKKTPRELRLTIFRQIVEPIYEGTEGIKEFTGRE